MLSPLAGFENQLNEITTISGTIIEKIGEAPNLTQDERKLFISEIADIQIEAVNTVVSVARNFALLQIPSGFLAAKGLGAISDSPTLQTIGGVLLGNMAAIFGAGMIAKSQIEEQNKQFYKLLEIESQNPSYLDVQERMAEITDILVEDETILPDDAKKALEAVGSNLLKNAVPQLGAFGLAQLLGSIANANHGYLRNDNSLLAGLGWFFFGSGLTGTGVALAEGYAKPIK